jgi:hypothetical protein
MVFRAIVAVAAVSLMAWASSAEARGGAGGHGMSPRGGAFVSSFSSHNARFRSDAAPADPARGAARAAMRLARRAVMAPPG